MIRYTVGFLFNEELTKLLLIQKKRGPTFNLGKWNGLGGKIELGEGIRTSIAREVLEEARVTTDCTEWSCYHKERTADCELYFMTAKISTHRLMLAKSLTDERITLSHLPPESGFYSDPSYVYNLSYLVDMARVWHRYPERRWLEG